MEVTEFDLFLCGQSRWPASIAAFKTVLIRNAAFFQLPNSKASYVWQTASQSGTSGCCWAFKFITWSYHHHASKSGCSVILREHQKKKKKRGRGIKLDLNYMHDKIMTIPRWEAGCAPAVIYCWWKHSSPILILLVSVVGAVSADFIISAHADIR